MPVHRAVLVAQPVTDEMLRHTVLTRHGVRTQHRVPEAAEGMEPLPLLVLYAKRLKQRVKEPRCYVVLAVRASGIRLEYIPVRAPAKILAERGRNRFR